MDALVVLLHAGSHTGDFLAIGLGGLASIFAIITGIFTIPKWWKAIRSFFKKIKRVADLIDYELQHNGGGSIKDHSEKSMNFASKALDVSKETDIKVNEVSSQVRDVAAQLHSFIQTHSLEHKALNAAISPPVTIHVEQKVDPVPATTAVSSE